MNENIEFAVFWLEQAGLPDLSQRLRDDPESPGNIQRIAHEVFHCPAMREASAGSSPASWYGLWVAVRHSVQRPIVDLYSSSGGFLSHIAQQAAAVLASPAAAAAAAASWRESVELAEAGNDTVRVAETVAAHYAEQAAYDATVDALDEYVAAWNLQSIRWGGRNHANVLG